MATVEFLRDDFDPKVTSLDSDVVKHEFEWQGERYTLDLGPANREKLQAGRDEYDAAVARARKKFEDKWMEKAVPVDDRTPPRRTGKPSGNGKSNKTDSSTAEFLTRVRTWARENGAEVNDRGRVADALKDAYRAGDPKKIPTHLFPSQAAADKAAQQPEKAPQKAEPGNVVQMVPSGT